MALRTIIFSDNPLLRKRSSRVPHITPDIRQLVEDMLETMRAANGVGLAAVQVGVPLRVIVVEIPEDLDDPDAGTSLALVNPELARVSKETEEGVEGCLSVPGWVGNVLRHQEVTVKGIDLKGRKVRFRAKGYLARVLQHEIDHLNGVLFIDRTDEIWPVEEGEEEMVEAEAAALRGAGGTGGLLE
ncbi:MAG TPA: peptide deformylase [Thermoflexia bacterium]|jgi:peptide deformylase|nr:peptide deformylase [Thermoflexia bacterium]